MQNYKNLNDMDPEECVTSLENGQKYGGGGGFADNSGQLSKPLKLLVAIFIVAFAYSLVLSILIYDTKSETTVSNFTNGNRMNATITHMDTSTAGTVTKITNSTFITTIETTISTTTKPSITNSTMTVINETMVTSTIKPIINNSTMTAINGTMVTTTTKPVITKHKKRCGKPVVQPNVGDQTLNRNRFKRIIYGDEAVSHSWPWMVSLQNNETGHFCGGSLIDSNFIITAAHCIFDETNETFRIAIGVHDLKNVNYDELYEIESMEMHENYENFTHDIALIKLKESINETANVSYLCLPENDSYFERIEGKEVIVAGWGRESNNIYDSNAATYLQELVLEIQNETVCSKSSDIFNSTLQYCALETNKRHRSNVCFGDSGGPNIMYFNDEWHIVGIVSYIISNGLWLYKECRTTEPSFYTKVSHYTNWIEKHMAEI